MPHRKEVGYTDQQLWEMKYSDNLTYDVLMEMTGLSIGSLQSRIYRYDRSIKNGGVPPRPDLFGEMIGEPLRLVGDYVIVSDVHVPTTDYDFAQRPAMIGKKYLPNKKRKIIVAGDLFNMDAFSTYAKLTQSSTFRRELEAARQIVSEWLRMFDEIVIIMGNHERRLQKWTQNQLDGDDLFQMVHSSPNVKTSNFGYCYLNSGGVDWLVAHPKNYSVNQLVALDPIAHKVQMNVVAGHDHHLAHGWDRYKHFQIASLGCLAKPDGFGYKQIDIGKEANFVQGFGMIKNGFLTLYGDDRFTDWGEVLK